MHIIPTFTFTFMCGVIKKCSQWETTDNGLQLAWVWWRLHSRHSSDLYRHLSGGVLWADKKWSEARGKGLGSGPLFSWRKGSKTTTTTQETPPQPIHDSALQTALTPRAAATLPGHIHKCTYRLLWTSVPVNPFLGFISHFLKLSHFKPSHSQACNILREQSDDAFSNSGGPSAPGLKGMEWKFLHHTFRLFP